MSDRTAHSDGYTDGENKINIAKNSYSSSILIMLDRHKEVALESAYTDSLIVPIHRLDTVAPSYIEELNRYILK